MAMTVETCVTNAGCNSHLAENQRRVLAAEAVHARHRPAHLRVARFMADVELAAVDDLSRIHGGGDAVVVNRQHRRRRVYAAAGGEVADLALDGRHWHGGRRITESRFQSRELRAVVRWQPEAVWH